MNQPALSIKNFHQQIALLLLQRLPGTAAGTLQQLYQHFDSLNGILQADYKQLAKLLNPAALATFEKYRRHGLKTSAAQQAQKDFDIIQKLKINLLAIEEPNYPAQLKEIHCAPPLLMVDGCIDTLSKEQLAIIGSRKASPSGLENAQYFSSELARIGFVITSGLALGIDAAAHRGALATDPDLNPTPTIAAVATGLDLCYPSRHKKLSQDIVERGAIVSEFPLGTPPKKENFPRRNRIISGLAKGVLVVEAEEKSGSLITAKYALEQNREVFAVPGSINNPASRGCHQLIRSGAKLVDSVDDILAELAHPFGQILMPFSTSSNKKNHLKQTAHKKTNQSEKIESLTQLEINFLQFLDENLATTDQLIRRAKLSADAVSALLLSLEIKGWVELSAGAYRLLKPFEK